MKGDQIDIDVEILPFNKSMLKVLHDFYTVLFFSLYKLAG